MQGTQHDSKQNPAILQSASSRYEVVKIVRRRAYVRLLQSLVHIQIDFSEALEAVLPTESMELVRVAFMRS
jgi:hypothetical protein